MKITEILAGLLPPPQTSCRTVDMRRSGIGAFTGRYLFYWRQGVRLIVLSLAAGVLLSPARASETVARHFEFGGEFKLIDRRIGSDPVVTLNSNGDAIIAYEVRLQATTYFPVAQVFSKEGVPQTSFQLAHESRNRSSAYRPVDIAINDLGDVAFVLENDNHHVAAAIHTHGGVTTGDLRLSGIHQNAAQVAISDDGNGVGLWEEPFGPPGGNAIFARIFSVGGFRSAKLNVAHSRVGSPKIGIDRDLTAVAWQDLSKPDHPLKTRYITPSSGLSDEKQITHPPSGVISDIDFSTRISFPEIVPQPGFSFYSWRSSVGGGQIQSRILRSRGYSDITNVTNFNATGPFAVSNGEIAKYGWTINDGVNLRIQARNLVVKGKVLGNVVDISPIGENAVNPQAGIDRYGNAVFVWQESGEKFKARAFLGEGVLGPIHEWVGASPRLAVNADGEAVIVWKRCCGRHGTEIYATFAH